MGSRLWNFGHLPAFDRHSRKGGTPVQRWIALVLRHASGAEALACFNYELSAGMTFFRANHSDFHGSGSPA